ncbi:uncharacterized protein LOC113377379 [Ctenocephalides felis]|uniref:uncharacterized protein LOC113377379 n=1 Tax=Ctenocephalides felis TaxID=7515 RepID=UPI000E6E30B6|nr:uncharacterized protein LOC113377379 [Ctenocephalides felis]
MKLIKGFLQHTNLPALIIEIFLVLLNFDMTFGHNDEGYCLFPEHWNGQWFQSGVQQSIIIERSLLSSKGRCISSKGDKFLLRDERNCYRCVVIHEKHLNVLQYKETLSHCHRKDSIQNLCQLITGDALLYSMFREQSVPVTCPLKGPFTFTYNRGHGECMNPVSNIESCTEDSRLILTYQACPDVHGTESAVEELECLATWNEGNARYLVGKMNHRHAITSEDRYRCFVYEKITGIGDKVMEYKIAQSGDATCNGLFSATEGSRTMTLKQAAIPERCRFPNWLAAGPSHWQTVDQSQIYWFHHRNSSLRIIKNNEVELQAHCSQINRQTADDVMIILQYSEKCTHGFICMHFYRRDNFIAELQIGTRSSRLEDACAFNHFDSSVLPYVTIVYSKSNAVNCPIPGHYSTHGLFPDNALTNHLRISDCFLDSHKLHIGCNNRETMEFGSDCSNVDSTDYSCHGSWIENGTTFIIASQQHEGNSTYYCLKYKTNGNDSSKLAIGNSCERLQSSRHFSEVQISQIGQCTTANSGIVWSTSNFAIIMLIAMMFSR